MLPAEKTRYLDLLRDVQFPGEEDNTYRIAVSGNPRRRAIIRAADDRDRATAAAVEIQRIWRGFRIREKYKSILEQNLHSKDRRSKRYPLLSRRYRDYLEWCSSALGVTESSSATVGFRDYCASIIQLWWKMARIGRGSGMKVTKRKFLSEQEAAQKIQNSWRGYCNKKTFNFYKQLIDFRRRGDPSVLLKSVNPTEAKLLDKASGACVRFRLGGTKFPPSIYYKIFTSQGVVDVCSYSPRDYTAMSYRRQLQSDIHNHGGRSLVDDGSNWYKRWENNGWRLVSEKFFQSRLQDSLTTETSVKRQSFHHSRLQRRADVKRKQRQKKIEWMKKLYHPSKQGEAVADAMPTAECHDTDVEEDIDGLLEWTHSLNYDEYVSEWSQIATSAALPALSDESDDHHVTVM